jgi:hypothetical protein
MPESSRDFNQAFGIDAIADKESPSFVEKRKK